MEAKNLFANSRMNITVEGKRYLDAVIGSTEYRDEYVKDLGLGQPTYHFVNYCRNNRKQLIQHLPVGLKQTKLLPENHSKHPPLIAASRKNN